MIPKEIRHIIYRDAAGRLKRRSGLSKNWNNRLTLCEILFTTAREIAELPGKKDDLPIALPEFGALKPQGGTVNEKWFETGRGGANTRLNHLSEFQKNTA